MRASDAWALHLATERLPRSWAQVGERNGNTAFASTIRSDTGSITIPVARGLEIDVVELSRQAKPVFRGSIGASTRFIAGQAAPSMTRLAIVMSVPSPEHGLDAAVCVPVGAFTSWEERAASAVDVWEAKRLLISTMPVQHRDEARADLLHVVAAALAAAAINGIDSTGRPEDL